MTNLQSLLKAVPTKTMKLARVGTLTAAAAIAVMDVGCTVQPQVATPQDRIYYEQVFAPQQLPLVVTDSPIIILPEGVPTGYNQLHAAMIDPRDKLTLQNLDTILHNYNTVAVNINMLVDSIQHTQLGLAPSRMAPLPPEERRKVAEDYGRWVEANADRIAQTKVAFNRIMDAEQANFIPQPAGIPPTDAVRVLDIHIDQLPDPALRDLGNAYLADYYRRMEAMQPVLKIMIASYIPEGSFQQLVALESLDNTIESRRNKGISYTDEGIQVININPAVSKTYTENMKDIESHWRRKDPNFRTEIMDDDRYAIVRTLWGEFKAGEINSKQLIGAIYVTDQQIWNYAVEVGGKDALINDLAGIGLRILPGGGVVDFFVHRQQHLFRPSQLADSGGLDSAPAVQRAAVYEFLGVEGRRNYAGSKGPVFVNTLIDAAATAFWINAAADALHGGGNGADKPLHMHKPYQHQYHK